MKKVLSVVLALVLMLSTVSIAIVAAPDSDYTMYIGETKTVSLPGKVYPDFAIVKFVAPGNGKVVIYSDGKSAATCNPVLEVYKNSLASSNRIVKVEDNASKHNFRYELNCQAGVTYFLAMHNSLSATSWDVSIECLHETYENGKCVTCLGDCTHELADNIVGCCPCGKEFNGEEIVVGEEVRIKSESDRVWFRFTPDETAPYILQSNNPDDDDTWTAILADPAFIIVDSVGKVVLANDADVSSDNKNFNFPYLFIKGESYFIGLNNKKALADDWYFTMASGTSHTVFVEQEITNADGSTTIETVAVSHRLDYTNEVLPTCQAEGRTPVIVCAVCNETIAGGDVLPKAAECKDADADNHCDWCDRVMVEPIDPSANCSCNCHKSGIQKFFFDFALFFQKIFRLNSVCKCGVRHY